MNNFTKLMKKYQLKPNLAKGLAMMGLKKPTPIQMQAIPSLLEERNTLVTAPTGTGKTLSYLVPIIQKCLGQEATAKKDKTLKNQKKSEGISAVILVPFQELSSQVKE